MNAHQQRSTIYLFIFPLKYTVAIWILRLNGSVSDAISQGHHLKRQA